ncbi:Sec-independent protein translocase protein TatB [Erwinia sp. E_sp_B04_7]|uniref:Sec-independent protein translocase protein TatB n=1 Tax=unclassified Erwinia TaxID=2622719 RepID=UPI0030D3EABD
MFDIGFSELILVFVIGLVVLGPQRLPVAVRTVVGWIRALRSLATNVQNELAQELKLQELQDSLKKVEEASKNSLSPELKASMDELKQSAESMKRSYLGENEQADDEANTIHNPLVKNPEDSHEGVTPAEADHQASAPAKAPEVATEPAQATASSGSTAIAMSVVAPESVSAEPVSVAQEPTPPASVEPKSVATSAPTASSPVVKPTATTGGEASVLSSRAPASTTLPSDER